MNHYFLSESRERTSVVIPTVISEHAVTPKFASNRRDRKEYVVTLALLWEKNVTRVVREISFRETRGGDS